MGENFRAPDNLLPGESEALLGFGENELVVALRKGNVGRVERIWELNVEAMVRPEVGTSKSGDYADDLEKGRAVVAGDASVGIHGL